MPKYSRNLNFKWKYMTKCGHAEHNSVLIKGLLQHLWCIPPLFVCLFYIKFLRPYPTFILHFPCGYWYCQTYYTCQNPTMLLTNEIALKISSSFPNFSLIWDSSCVFVWTVYRLAWPYNKDKTLSILCTRQICTTCTLYFNSFWHLCLDFPPLLMSIKILL